MAWGKAGLLPGGGQRGGKFLMNDCFDHKRRRPSSLKTAAQFMMGMGLAVCRTHVCFDRDRLDISGRADNCDCAVGKARQLDRPAFKIREDDTL